MDYKIMSAVYYRDVQLTQYEYCVLMTLACAAKDDKSLPSPSLKRIADRSGMSVRQVSRTVATLSERGLLSVSKRQTASGQWCNLYHVHTDKFGTQKPIDESEYKSGSESNMDSQSNMDGSTKSGEGVQRVAKSGSESNYNNIVNNIDNNKENNKETDKTVDSGVKGGLGGNQPMPQKVEPPKVEPTTPHTEKPAKTSQAPTPQTSRSVCLDDVLPREIAKMALAKLVAEGMPDQEGKNRINGTWKTYLAELDTLKGRGWKKKNGEAITSANYLVGMLATMAKEYKPSEPQAEEPTRLEEIFELLKKEWEEQYPEVAEYIKCLGLNDFWQNTIDALRADEVAGWSSKSGVTSVRNRLKGFVFAKVQAWRQDEIKDISSCLYHVRKALAQYRCEPKSYYNPQKTVEEEIAELEEREKKCHAELQRLRELTTRPTAA